LILKPDSLLELSFQLRLIWLDETAVAERLLGELGTEPSDWVVAEGIFDQSEDPAALYDCTA
jgi:hypothetical protein